MRFTMKVLAFLSVGIFFIFLILNIAFPREWLFSLAITFATISYHFWMRLMVGYLVNKGMDNRADYTKKRYQLHPAELGFYGLIRVKKWKGKMPSYDPELFSPKKHTWDEIAQAMCQAEVVHEIIVILSFVPIIAAVFFGSFYVFLWTSIAAAFFDSLFVIMQRYNRPRVIKMAEKRRQK